MKRKAPPLGQSIPLALIDPPALAMREKMDQTGMERLIESVALFGVILPIVVKPTAGGRYEIVDGHRRYVAATHAELKEIPAVVRVPGAQSMEALKCHANYFREDVNPAEEASFLNEVLERDAGGDVDRLGEMLCLRRTYIEDRLLLLKGDPKVLEAVKDGLISFSVARELNRVKQDGVRWSYLEAAIAGGATARLVIQWRTESEKLENLFTMDPGDGSNQHTGVPPAQTAPECLACHGTDEPWTLQYLVIHARCKRIFLDPLLKKLAETLGTEFTVEAVNG